MSQFGPPFLTSPAPLPPPPHQGHSSCCRGNVSKRWFMSGSGSERLCRANSTEFMSNGWRQRRENRNKVRVITSAELILCPRVFISWLFCPRQNLGDKFHNVFGSSRKSFPKFQKIKSD